LSPPAATQSIPVQLCPFHSNKNNNRRVRRRTLPRGTGVHLEDE
jgi:hypothetical protein